MMLQELIDLLRSEVDTVLYKVSEAENTAAAVREDLSPEIATLEDSVERYPQVFLPTYGGSVGSKSTIWRILCSV